MNHVLVAPGDIVSSRRSLRQEPARGHALGIPRSVAKKSPPAEGGACCATNVESRLRGATWRAEVRGTRRYMGAPGTTARIDGLRLARVSPLSRRRASAADVIKAMLERASWPSTAASMELRRAGMVAVRPHGAAFTALRAAGLTRRLGAVPCKGFHLVPSTPAFRFFTGRR